MVIVKAKIREEVGDFRVSEDFLTALEKHVLEDIKAAKRRAEANGRKTLMAHDI